MTAALETLAERRVSGILEIDGSTPIRLCDLGAPAAVVQDLAWQCGLALYEAMECVGLLVQAGVCAPCARPEGPAGPLAQWFGSGAGEPRVLSPTAVLPPPQPEVLRRVLDGLRRLG